MKNFKGTKGNWQVGIAFQGETENIEIKNSGKLLTVEDTDGKAIAILGRIAEDEQEANALLISKAPELLETLLNLHQAISSGNPHLLSEWNLKAKALTHEILKP